MQIILRLFSRLLATVLLLTSTARATEWMDLFDGKTTNGWTPRSKVLRFEARDGVLELHSKTNCWVTTDVEMRDFEAELEVLLPEDARQVNFNSGFAYRCAGGTGKPRGYQCEIDLQKPAGIYGIGLGGWLYPGREDNQNYQKKVKGLLKERDWNHFRVVARGSLIRTYLNGTLIAELYEARQLGGYFGIQHHGKGGTVRFRNIRARRLYPNILWITAEDMSPYLGCYGDKFATTPHLDQFAKESVRYTRAFAAAPVCSPSRACLITGVTTVSLGAHQMRSAFPIPDRVKAFPSYLRKAGYFTSNNVKTDYNNGATKRLIAEAWNESSGQAHWRSKERDDGQPFFAVFNDMSTHQSRTTVWPHEVFVREVQSKLPKEDIHDPAKVPLPPYYPDTPVIRKEWARMYDCVAVMDRNTGRLLRELEEDGLAENTIVFFYSDHGTGMPRGKRMLHDSGMRVALMTRFPKRYQHLASSPPGTVNEELVSFVDFPGTALNLAGLAKPDYMQGRRFLGENQDPERAYVYGCRDRVDEVFECARSLRSRKYLYIRNYHPYLSHNQPSVFSDLGAARQEISRLARESPRKLNKEQMDYAGPGKPAEAFYDCDSDPHNLVNLLEGKMTAEQQEALREHRRAYEGERIRLRDPGAIPEDEMWRWVRNEGKPLHDILLGKSDHQPSLVMGWKAADLVGRSDFPAALKLLKSADPTERYWAVIALRAGDYENRDPLVDYLDDISASVRIEVADWLAQKGKHRKPALDRLTRELAHKDWWVALRACRSIELLGKDARSALPAMKKLYAENRTRKGDGPFYLAFSSGAFLDALGEDTQPWDFSPGAGAFTPEPDKKQDRDRARIGK
ncbi:MAG: sulfatase-like hydrolase/transferase [Verrucomicrobiota bacterium]|nr:sulfatase-like hydrolase/transferase [Verrucomicrobiota bacterium]